MGCERRVQSCRGRAEWLHGTWSTGETQVPAPPNGPPSSEIGLATSTDGVHWIKSPANPIIRKDASRGSVEDPDLLWPKGSNEVYIEYNYHPEKMSSSLDFIHWSDPWLLNTGKTPGKMGGFIDTQNEPAIPAIQFGGTAYRYITMIEEGGIDLSTDLHQWVKAGSANLRGTPEAWCSDHECSGDIFVDHDGNIRYESQIGVKPASGHGGGVVGNRLCTIGEGVLSGSDPTKVLWKSDLPWLTRLVRQRAHRRSRGFHGDERFGLSGPNHRQRRLALALQWRQQPLHNT